MGGIAYRRAPESPSQRRHNGLLDRASRGLKAAYDRVWQEIQIFQYRRGRAKVMARHAYLWIMCSWLPLSPVLLTVAVRQNPESEFDPNVDITIDYIPDVTRDLIKLDGASTINGSWISDKVYRFSHLYVQEYFEMHHWDVNEAHPRVGQVCLRLWTSLLYVSDRLWNSNAFWPEEERFADLHGDYLMKLVSTKGTTREIELQAIFDAPGSLFERMAPRLPINSFEKHLYAMITYAGVGVSDSSSHSRSPSLLCHFFTPS